MSTLFEPVGPHEPRVYWRRRLGLLAVLIVAAFLVLRACSGGGDDGTPTAGSSPETSESAAESTTAKAKATQSSTATTSAAAGGQPPLCADDQVEVTATTSRTSFPAGSAVDIRYVVATKDGATCRRDVGAGANEVKVVQGDDVIWSSDHCSPSQEKDVRTLGPDASYSVVVQWDGSVTTADCPAERSKASTGEYEVQGRNADVTGAGAPLVLT